MLGLIALNVEYNRDTELRGDCPEHLGVLVVESVVDLVVDLHGANHPTAAIEDGHA